MEKEVWVDIKGYEGLYQISNIGNVKRLERIIHRKGINRRCKHRELIMKPSDNGKGYKCITLFKNGFRRIFYIHRLVGLHFLNKPIGKDNINHIDLDKSNNYFLNLEWCTHLENMTHQNELFDYHRGDKGPNAKLSQKIVDEIRANYLTGQTRKELAKNNNVSKATIRGIVLRLTWK